MKSVLALLVTTCLCFTAKAYSVENIFAAFDGDKVVITYNLIYTDPNQKFKISFYSSHDNYTNPIAAITGDVGENILPGRAKRAVWSVRGELPADFDSEIKIKIKATRVVAPALVIEPLALKTYKKGRTVSMQWTGGYPTDKVTIELYKNNAAALRVAEQTNNSGTYEWKMPKSVKGKNYTLRLTNASQAGAQVESTAFNVKPRTPFIVKILPVLAIGGALYFLNGDDGTGEPPVLPPTDDVLPTPINPGG